MAPGKWIFYKEEKNKNLIISTGSVFKNTEKLSQKKQKHPPVVVINYIDHYPSPNEQNTTQQQQQQQFHTITSTL